MDNCLLYIQDDLYEQILKTIEIYNATAQYNIRIRQIIHLFRGTIHFVKVTKGMVLYRTLIIGLQFGGYYNVL